MDLVGMNKSLLGVNCESLEPAQQPPLVLAYLGDAVFELYVRSKVIGSGQMSADSLHKASKDYVRASAQARMYRLLEPVLSEEELAVMKRGRNAKAGHVAKNASVADYRHATGLEALFGYLFLKEETARIMELFSICMGK